MDIPSFDEVFRQIKVNFWLLGIPFHTSRISLRFYIFFFSLTLTVLQEIGFFISESSTENFLTLTQLAPCTCIGILSIIKLLLLVYKRHRVFKLTDSLETTYHDIVNNVKKANKIRQNFVFLKYLTKYYYILNGVLISVYNFSSLIIILYHYIDTKEVSYILPYSLYVPFSTDNCATWSAVYLHSISSGFICVLYFTTVDALYYIMSTHVYSHFTLLSSEIIDLDADNSYLLNDIVKRHQYILKLSEDLEDIFTAPNLFNVLVGSLEICALGFNLTMGKWTQTPGVVLFLFSVLLQIFMMSVFGENLIRESRGVGEAAFLCKWYTMDQRSKKTILQLIQRSSKPQKLTAYKFSTISYESFIKIISRSWSYFTILKTVYKPPEIIYN
ncbi:putative odorant receptor 92a [Epargyreus clarus]|uniref:putative odorant receptor 92a n=1 Tax=Epargyreus clarus TaxID=520877 RepID=UPI003C2E13C2